MHVFAACSYPEAKSERKNLCLGMTTGAGQNLTDVLQPICVVEHERSNSRAAGEVDGEAIVDVGFDVTGADLPDERTSSSPPA